LRIREYQDVDLVALRAIHSAQGFPYEFPDLKDPLFLTKLVLLEGKTDDASREVPPENLESGQGIVGAALLRLTAEAYLLLDPKLGNPRERWEWILALQEATQRDALARGLEDVHAWLPPAIATKFGQRLSGLGWTRDDAWTPYCKRLVAK
jgi:hypothetical protein